MDDQPSPQSEEQLKADIIAKQNAAVEKMLGSSAPTNRGAQRLYENNKLSILMFICTGVLSLVAPIGILLLVAAVAPNLLVSADEIYSVGIIILVIWSYLTLRHSDFPKPPLIALFVFSAVTVLVPWVGLIIGIYGFFFCWVICMVLVYTVLSHNDWIES